MAEPLILYPDSALLHRYPGLLRQSSELSQTYADHKLLVTDAALQAIGTQLCLRLFVRYGKSGAVE